MSDGETAHVGHVDIHEDHVGMQLPYLAESFDTVSGFPDDLEIGASGKAGADSSADDGVVVH